MLLITKVTLEFQIVQFYLFARKTHCEAKKLHQCIFSNNSVKS